MAWSIKPLLGQGQLQFISVYDESIDWEKTPFPMSEYTGDPLKLRPRLAFKEGRTPTIFRLRAAEEVDRLEVDTSHLRITEGGVEVIERHGKKENWLLFRRCIQGIENYTLEDGTKVGVALCPGPDGKPWAEEATMRLIPMEVACEIGMYLHLRSTPSDTVKNA